MVFQNCNMSNATIQTINTPTTETAAAPAAPEDAPLPDELDTPEAHDLLQRLMQAGMLNERWQPVDLTLSQKGVLARALAERLKIEHQWQCFGTLWSMKPDTLRKADYNAQDRKNTLQFQDALKEAFK